MITKIVKAIAAGILGGIALFLMQFILLRILAIFILIRLIFRITGSGPRHWRGGPAGSYFYPAFSRRWQHMNEEEKRSFRERMETEFFSKMNQ